MITLVTSVSIVGLPTQVRDKYLNMDEKIPTSAVNKDYYLQNKEALLNNTDGKLLMIS